jgi:hypothetical protein
MPDLVITAANVVASGDATTATGIAGAAITAGQAIYVEPTTGRYVQADSNSANVPQRRASGVSLNAASIGQPVSVVTQGDVTIGSTVVAGTAYYLSDTPGGICPFADVGTGEAVCLMGIAKSTTVLALAIQFPGVVL